MKSKVKSLARAGAGPGFAVGAAGAPVYRESVHITPWMPPADSSGSITVTNDTSVFTLGYYRLENDAEYMEWNVPLVAGTWSLRVVHITASTGGVVDYDLDSTEVASIDMYSGSTVPIVVSTTTGITVAADGIYPLRARTDGKNASSSGYRHYGESISLVRTGA